MEDEKPIYQTCPSQIRNLGAYLLAVVMAAVVITAALLADNNIILLGLIIPVIYAFWKWMAIKTTRLNLTDQRIIVSEGILNKTTNETELYRVRDTTIEEPFFFRIFGLGNVIVFTTDEASPTHKFIAYKKPHWIKDQIRNYSEVCRKRNRWGNDNVLLHDHNGEV